MASATATFIVKNKTKHPIYPSKPYPNYVTKGVFYKEPETILAKQYGSAGNYELDWNESYGTLVAYVSPDPESMFVVLYSHLWISDQERAEEHVKTAFLPSDVALTNKVYSDIYNSKEYIESATHTYTDSDGKEQKLTLIASVDRQVNVNVDIKLRNEHPKP